MAAAARLAVANAAASLVRGFPVSSSGSRTAIGVAAGSRTQLPSVTAALAVLAVLYALRPLLTAFPLAALTTLRRLVSFRYLLVRLQAFGLAHRARPAVPHPAVRRRRPPALGRNPPAASQPEPRRRPPWNRHLTAGGSHRSRPCCSRHVRNGSR
jgi:hypothetical protein